MNLAGIPAEMTSLNRWVLWRKEKVDDRDTKVPYYVNGSLRRADSTDSATWHSYEDAVRFSAQYKVNGIGFCLGDGTAGIDFDGCRNPQTGEIDDWAMSEMVKLNSYSEISPSWTGAKVFVHGHLPGAGTRKTLGVLGHGGKERAIEMYDSGRYFAVTGELLPDFSFDVQERDIAPLYNKIKNIGAQKQSGNDSQQNGQKIPKGNRTPTLFSMAGSMRRRGMDAEAIEAALRIHNEKYCDPPLSAEKIRQLAKDVCRYTPDPIVETVTVNELGRADMPKEVLDGRLGEICERYMQDAPLAYAWPALVTIAGASPWLKYAFQEIRSNLYGCLVGAVGTGKTAVFERALHVLGIDPLDPVILSAKYGSAEGLANELKGKGSCVRLLAPDELAHLLRKCAIEHSSFPTFLTSAFYQDRQKGGTKKDEFEVDCRLSIFGGIVEDDFGDCFGAATTAGLYDRMLFGLVPQLYEYEYYPPKSRAAAFAVSPPLLDGSVWEVRNQWRKAGIAGRVAENALRVAFVCASADGRKILRGADLTPALALAEYQMKVRAVLQPNPGQNPDAQTGIAIMQWMRSNAPNGEWVRRRTLSKAIHSERVGAGIFNRALQNLQMNDSIELETKQKILRLGTEEI